MKVDYFAGLSVPGVPGTPSTTGDTAKPMVARLSPVSPVSPVKKDNMERQAGPESITRLIAKGRKWVAGWPFTCSCGTGTGWTTDGVGICPSCAAGPDP